MPIISDMHQMSLDRNQIQPKSGSGQQGPAGLTLHGVPSDGTETGSSAIVDVATGLEAGGDDIAAPQEHEVAQADQANGKVQGQCALKTAPGSSEEQLNFIVYDTMHKLGIRTSERMVECMSHAKKKTFHYFRVACELAELPVAWGAQQLEEFFLYLDDLFFARATLMAHWRVVKEVSRNFKVQIPPRLETLFDFVLAGARPVKDNKLPVTKKLLRALCGAATRVLEEYDATIAQAMFLAAWAGFMRCCEMTAPQKGRRDHNIFLESIQITEDGMGITFWSGKSQTMDPTPRHRFTGWGYLPSDAKQVMLKYLALRPAGVDRFFTRRDGRHVTRDEFLNFLDVCLIQTRYANLRITGHGFRIGSASFARMSGFNILNIKDHGRWGAHGRVTDHYTRVPFMKMPLEQIWNTQERYRRTWDPDLAFITNQVVQTKGDSSHPHLKMLHKMCPDRREEIDVAFAEGLPAPGAQLKLAEVEYHVQKKTYLKAIFKARLLRTQRLRCREAVAKLARKAVKTIEKAAGWVPGHRLKWRRFKSVAIQTEGPIRVDLESKGSQVNSLRLAHPKEMKSVQKGEISVQTDEVDAGATKIVATIVEDTTGGTDLHRAAEIDAELVGKDNTPWYKVCKRSYRDFGTPAACSEADKDTNKSKYRNKQSIVPYYMVEDDEGTHMVTGAEFKEMFPGQPKPSTIQATERRKAVNAIRYRLSKRFRKYKSVLRLRARHKVDGGPMPVPLPPVRINYSMRKLINHFIDPVLVHHDKALPPMVEWTDPEDTDDEFKKEVLKFVVRASPKAKQQEKYTKFGSSWVKDVKIQPLGFDVQGQLKVRRSVQVMGNRKVFKKSKAEYKLKKKVKGKVLPASQGARPIA